MNHKPVSLIVVSVESQNPYYLEIADRGSNLVNVMNPHNNIFLWLLNYS